MQLPPAIRRLHPDNFRIARAAGWLLLLTAAAKLAGAAREIAIAWRFGRGVEADAYNLAFTLAMWLPLAIYSVMTVVVVPALVRLRAGEAGERRQFVRELTGAALAAGLALAAATWLLAPWIVRAYASGLPPETGELAEVILRSFAPLALLTLAVAVFATRLQAAQDHRYALAEGFPPLAVAALLVVWTTAEILPLVVGTLAGFTWQAWWLGRHAKEPSGSKGPVTLRFRSPQWRPLLGSALIMGAGQIAMSFVQPIDQWFAATLGAGTIATLGYANRVIALGMALGATVIARATLPVFAEGIVRGDTPRVRAQALAWAWIMLAAGLALAAVVWLSAPWIVAVLFERGAFSAADTEAVAIALRWGVWQLPPYLAGLVLVSQLAGEGRYRLIALVGLVNVIVKLICTYLLADILGPSGIMLATVVMYSGSALLGWLAVRGAARTRNLNASRAGER